MSRGLDSAWSRSAKPACSRGRGMVGQPSSLWEFERCQENDALRGGFDDKVAGRAVTGSAILTVLGVKARRVARFSDEAVLFGGWTKRDGCRGGREEPGDVRNRQADRPAAWEAQGFDFGQLLTGLTDVLVESPVVGSWSGESFRPKSMQPAPVWNGRTTLRAFPRWPDGQERDALRTLRTRTKD
jgi:hypothetical protein